MEKAMQKKKMNQSTFYKKQTCMSSFVSLSPLRFSASYTLSPYYQIKNYIISFFVFLAARGSERFRYT